MDYTQSNAYATDVGTGNRLHQQSAAIPTAVTDVDMNGLIWELMTIIKNAGLTPVPFDKTASASYSQVYQAIQLLAAASSGGLKLPVRFTTTGNIVLSGLGTQAGGDWGGALTAGDRILPKDQTTGADKGIYIAAAGAWTRATDADGAGELIPGALVVVSEGVTLADSLWELSTDAPITIGTTALAFIRKDGGGAVASTGDAQTGTDNTKMITSLRMREGFNASGSAPVYAARAWVNFNGTGTVAIRASGNVSSITDNGTGDYTINFTTALPDANYAVAGSAGDLIGQVALIGILVNETRQTTGGVRIYTSSSVKTDVQNVALTVTR